MKRGTAREPKATYAPAPKEARHRAGRRAVRHRLDPLRANQFHDLILTVAKALARLPVIPAPAGTRFQPVDATEVAARMAELALDEPCGLVPDLAGPKIYTVAELVNSYVSAVGMRRPLVPVRTPGQTARAIRAGANLAPEHADGQRTWEEYLAGRI